MIFAEIIECQTRRHRRARTRRACFWGADAGFGDWNQRGARHDHEFVARHAAFDQHRGDFFGAPAGHRPI
jgi:hypothetical protein